MSEILIGEISDGELSFYSNETSINSASTYEEAVTRVVRGDAEFAEFPLDTLGTFAKELVDLMANTSAPNINDTVSTTLLTCSQRNLIEDKLWSFMKQNFNNLDNSLIPLIVSKIDKTIDYITSHSSNTKAIKGCTSASLRSMTQEGILYLNWHTDNTETPSIRTVISLKGTGTKFCQLSTDERAEFYKIGGSINHSRHLPALSQLCTNESNLFQTKPYHGVIFRTGGHNNLPAIHTIPEFIGNRITIIVNKFI